MESLLHPQPEELDMGVNLGQDIDFEELIEEAHDLPTERIERILAGEESIGLFDKEDLLETLLRRKMAEQETEYSGINPNLLTTSAIFIFLLFVFFGWTLYKSLRDREKKREEKKKLKQKKKK
ncbi:hypothetical protein AAG570_000333 [Ranatra chinensis]|uniref:Uncharacterized protein n=1 Tax=Ranatra chinensis TaxID=642074 RepID=A0ABD0YWR8_9HEMI